MSRKTSQRARGRWERADEPVMPAEYLAAGPDGPVFVADHTTAGFPIGVPLAEVRRSAERDARGAGWARAKQGLRFLVELEVGPVRDIGWVKKIGEGLSRDIYAAEVELEDGATDQYVVALPRGDAEPGLAERVRRELQLIARLRGRTFPFRLPEMLGAFADGEGAALVRRFVQGIELDLRAGRQQAVRPWEIVGEIAAAVHATPGADVADILSGSATRRAHALEVLAHLDDPAPELRDARAWALEHLPADEPSSLLHGDLLGQNILLALDGPPHVIDWEYARRGDPAYDLAIVTRGAKQPFQIERGLERLLDDYRAHGGAHVTADDVRLHELCMVGAWYRDALAGRGVHPPSQELGRMRSLLRRLR